MTAKDAKKTSASVKMARQWAVTNAQNTVKTSAGSAIQAWPSKTERAQHAAQVTIKAVANAGSACASMEPQEVIAKAALVVGCWVGAAEATKGDSRAIAPSIRRSIPARFSLIWLGSLSANGKLQGGIKAVRATCPRAVPVMDLLILVYACP